MNRKWALHVASWLLVAWTSGGCGPRITPDDLGIIEHEIPKVPGADQPFPLPELEIPADAGQASSQPAADQPPDSAAAERPTEETKPPVANP